MTGGPRCGACAQFRNEGAYLEREVCGLASLSSGDASVRGDDGLCLHHCRFVTAADSCPAFTPLEAAALG